MTHNQLNQQVRVTKKLRVKDSHGSNREETARNTRETVKNEEKRNKNEDETIRRFPLRSGFLPKKRATFSSLQLC